MNRFWIGLLAAAVLITGGIFFTKEKVNKPISEGDSGVSDDLVVPTPVAGETVKPNKVAASPQPAETSTPKIDKQMAHEQKLRSEGYIDNPDDPYSLIKKSKRTDGKEIVQIVPKDVNEYESLEPQDRDKKTAEEIIESKKDINPAEEIDSFRRLDDNEQNSMMMLGHFRDEAKDLEIFFGPTTDDKGAPLQEDIICLVSPKYNLNFRKNFTGSVRTDDTGYALLKASDAVYARVAWSFGKTGRVLHGQVLNVSGGTTKLVTAFEAKESPRSKGKLKYCD